LYKSRKHNKYEICVICNPIGKGISNGEKQLCDFISSIYNGVINLNIRSVIKPYELDVFLPALRLAFEFNGTYNHADPRFYKSDNKIRYLTAQQIWDKDKFKRQLCLDQNIELVTIWQYDWESSQDETKKQVQQLILI
jgi:hypothetical protein